MCSKFPRRVMTCPQRVWREGRMRLAFLQTGTFCVSACGALPAHGKKADYSNSTPAGRIICMKWNVE